MSENHIFQSSIIKTNKQLFKMQRLEIIFQLLFNVCSFKAYIFMTIGSKWNQTVGNFQNQLRPWASIFCDLTTSYRHGACGTLRGAPANQISPKNPLFSTLKHPVWCILNLSPKLNWADKEQMFSVADKIQNYYFLWNCIDHKLYKLHCNLCK